MKTLHNNRVAVGTLMASALLFTTCILFSDCKREDGPEPVPTTPTTFERPDSVADLIAYFSPVERLLLVDENFRTQVLQELGAQPATNGTFRAESVNLLGEPVIIVFTVAPMLAEMKTGVAAEMAKPLTPDLAHQFMVNGTDFRLYKNAKCGAEQKAFTGPCTDLPDGGSSHNVWYGVSNCARGDGFCTELRGAIGRRVSFANAGCQGAITNEEPYYGWRCKSGPA